MGRDRKRDRSGTLSGALNYRDTEVTESGITFATEAAGVRREDTESRERIQDTEFRIQKEKFDHTAEGAELTLS